MKDSDPDQAFEDALANLQYVLIARRVQASDEPMRLNWKHFDIMALIKERQSIAPSVISETLSMSRSSTSKYLKSLEEKGLITKSSLGKDRRSHNVVLTEQADEILNNIYKGQHTNAALASEALSPEELQQFTRIAKKITAALDSDELRTV
jgi:DNA-binding MarR family transcriptional regulator